jgi:hypothetical protein
MSKLQDYLVCFDPTPLGVGRHTCHNSQQTSGRQSKLSTREIQRNHTDKCEINDEALLFQIFKYNLGLTWPLFRGYLTMTLGSLWIRMLT